MKTLMGGRKMTKYYIIGAAITVFIILVVVAIHSMITRYFFRAVLEREEPPSMKYVRNRIMSAPELKPAMEAMSQAEIALVKMPHTEVSIKGHDGEELVGHLYTVPNAKRVIIAMHGWRSFWSRDFALISSLLRETDSTVLYVEQRGQNKSGGKYMTFGLHERYDCLYWTLWVNETINKERLPIYLAGVSMGASTVLMASAQPLPSNVQGIISDCAFTSPHAIWRYVVKEKLRLGFKIRGQVINDIMEKKLKTAHTEYSTEDALRDSRIPVLFIHGSSDRLVPVDMTYKNYIACSAPKELLIVPGADHGLSYFVDKERCEAAVRGFFDKYDAEPHPYEEISEPAVTGILAEPQVEPLCADEA